MHIPTDFEYLRTDPGVINIPDPIVTEIIKFTEENNPSSLFNWTGAFGCCIAEKKGHEIINHY